MSDQDPQTFVDVVRAQAARRPGQRVCTFLGDGEEPLATLTYGELERRVSSAAARLSTLTAPSDRALLLYPQGLDFIVSFLGCLAAGVVPVPVSLPNRQRGADILRALALDSGARLILSAGALLDQQEQALDGDEALRSLPRVRTDEWQVDSGARDSGGELPARGPAFLQYTSGSTGAPRGVVIHHDNLIDNQRQVQKAFGYDERTRIVSWLPMFHDMGLGTVLQAIWLGVEITLMSPTAFLQKPVRWLRAISRHQATTSGGPDFAYDLCARKIGDDAVAGLDLSGWRVAFNGAEPVRAATLDRFVERFGACGFRRDAFYPVYGLAESTVFVTGGDPRRPPAVAGFSSDGLQQGRVERDLSPKARALVGCGRPWADTRVAIVDPERDEECPPDRVGEIWVSGGSVGGGYWNCPEDSATTFEATLAGSDRPYLRTGDLGFVNGGHLFVTGRLKDLIIIRGRNHYPQDIEASVSSCHPALEPSGAAAFSIDADGSERLVVAVEVKRTALRSLDSGDVLRAIRRAVSDRHALHVYALVLMRPATLPRTSSGKVQRKACRLAYLEQRLDAVASWVFWMETPEPAAAAGSLVAPAPIVDDLLAWIRRYAAARINSRVIDERRTVPPYIVLDFGNRGLLGMQVSAAHGGLGLGHRDTVRILEQLAGIDLTLCLFVGLNNYLGIRPIATWAPSALQQELLPRLALGRELAAFALTEPGAGSDPRAIAARAEVDGAGWRLHGTKIWSGTASWAGVLNVFARHAAADGHPGGISGFVVRQGSPGLRQGPEALTMGMRGMIQNTVYLEGVAVGRDQLLGREQGGMDVAQDAMMHARLAIAAASVGGMKRCGQIALRYASQRRVATGRLLAHPVTLARLGVLTAAIFSLETLVDRVASATDRAASVPVEAFAACKVAGPELLWQAADGLVQLLGGRGYIETNLAPQLLRDARVLRIFEGPTETLTAFLGARLLSGADGLRRLVVDLLGAPAVAPLLDEAAARVRDRMKRIDGVLSRDAAPAHWAQARAGELAVQGVLLAAAEGARLRDASATAEHAAAWARARFDATLSTLTTDTAEERAAIDADALSRAIAAYASTIGDLEQALAGENHELDPMLRLQGAGAAGAVDDAPVFRPAGHVAPLFRPACTVDAASLRAWLAAWLVTKLRIAPHDVDPARSFSDHGLDSLMAVELVTELSERLGRPLDDTLLWNHPSIDALVDHLTTADSPDSRAGEPRHGSPGPRAEAPASLDDEIARLQRLLGDPR